MDGRGHCIGIAGIAGKLITGALLDRCNANRVGGFMLAFTALAFALLIEGVHSTLLVVAAVAINGYGSGCTLQITSYLMARHAGMRNFGAIYGVVTSANALGSGVGPMIAGMAYDRSGTYDGFLIAGVIGCLTSGLLIWFLPAAPIWEAPPEAMRRGPVLPGTASSSPRC